MKFAISALALSLCACSRGTNSPQAAAQEDVNAACDTSQVSAAQNTKILFIGNSFTAVNCLPHLFASLTKSAQMDVESVSTTAGGMSLAGHSTLASTLDLIASVKWNFVVLQDQSQTPAFRIDYLIVSYVPKVQALVNAIHARVSAENAAYLQRIAGPIGHPDP